MMPHDLGAERQLLAGLLLFPSQLAAAQGIVRPGDFYAPAHESTYAALLQLADEGTVPDAHSVARRLEATSGTAPRLSEGDLAGLQAELYAQGAVLSHARTVADLAARRRLQALSYEGAAKALDLSRPLVELVSEQESALAELVMGNGQAPVWDMADLGTFVLGEARRRREEGEPVGMPSGFLDLDQIVSGLRPGNLVLLGARPAMGKTALAVGIAAHAALMGTPTLLISAEMSGEEIGRRVLAAVAQVPLEALEEDTLDPGQRGKAERAVEAFGQVTFHVLAQPSPSVAAVRAVAKTMAATSGLGLVVLDYLQLLRLEDAERHDLAVGAAAWSLKGLALELGCPVVLLSQLNRDLEKRADRRPTLADLRDSGRLEEHADVVLFVYRNEVYNLGSPDRGTAEVIVAKNRHGPTGTVRLAFLADQARFADLSSRDPAF
jgi:replicative DNA helicase